MVRIKELDSSTKYFFHCWTFLETNFNGYGIRKLYDILNSINPSQQHALAGLDAFVTDGIEAWKILKGSYEIHFH